VLNDMVEEPFYEETTTASYLSTESAELRASVIQSVKLWWEKMNRQHDEIAEPLKAVQDAASEGR
jgi:hypothetical protein